MLGGGQKRAKGRLITTFSLRFYSLTKKRFKPTKTHQTFLIGCEIRIASVR